MGRATASGRIGPTFWWIAAALLFSLAMFGAMGWHVFNTFDVGRHLKAEAARSEELRNRLCQLHQQLTSNAVMVVASGDPHAEERQRGLADTLAALIDEARAQAPTASDLDTLWETHETQQELRAIEERAFALARRGEEVAALALLSGTDYQALQNGFSSSAARFVNDYRSRLDDRLLAERDKELASLVAAFVIFIVTLIVWLVLMTQLRRRERALVAEVGERERAEVTLQRREAVLAQAQEIAQLGSFERDARTGEERWSDEFYRILGYAPGAFPPSQQLFFERVHRDDLARLKRVAEAAATSTAGYALEARIVRPSGEERSVSLRAKLERDAQGAVVRTVGTLYDATEQKQIEARVEQSRQQLRSLAAHLLSVREQERAAVAKEIHDEVGQIVAAVRMDLAAVQKKLGPVNNKEQERLEHTIGLLGGVVETVQRVMSELHPPVPTALVWRRSTGSLGSFRSAPAFAVSWCARHRGGNCPRRRISPYFASSRRR
jgi:PAS domain S-box-containing protein